MAEKIVIRPQAGPQTNFLATPADICIYGGAAGGGKTWALLLEPLRHINNKKFGAVIFRRTYPQITNGGGLWDKSMELYPLAGGRPRMGELDWQFPSGVKLKMAHMQYDVDALNWQGSEIPLIQFDELTHFSRYQFFYMLSRNRSMSGIRPYMRATCNPDADSWVAKFIEWWIDQNTGYAIPERGGVIRWFAVIDDVTHWADSSEELKAKHSTAGLDVLPKSFTFIPAKLSDNQALVKADPGYRANLEAMPLIERERLLGGNWKIRPAAGKVFNRDWFEVVDMVPKDGLECRGFDFAATVKKLVGDDPDYTASVKIRKFGDVYYITDMTNKRIGPPDAEKELLRTCRNDLHAIRNTPIRYMVRWETEPGSASIRESYRLVTLLDGFDAGGQPSQGDKLARAMPFAKQAEAGNVKLLRGPWNEELLTHLHHQPDFGHDDIMDAASLAYNELVNAVVDLSGAFG